MNPDFNLLKTKLDLLIQEKYPSASRIHPLHSFANKNGAHYFVKRDDELGFGISGTKFRKYKTLLPFIKQQHYKQVILIGGAFSNNVLSCSQLLIENGIEPLLFLKGPKPTCKSGNFLFNQLLVPPSQIHWIAHENWPHVDCIAREYAKNHPSTFVLEEGASHFYGFLGAMSLALDIIRNEEEEKLRFDHLYIDAGTGCTACALLLAFALLKKETFCHILLTAESSEPFLKKLKEKHREFENWLGVPCDFPPHFRLFKPTLCTSFGSTNQTLFAFIAEQARSEGFFLDPVYSAKLFYEAKKEKDYPALTGNILLIHSGGAFSLAGFQERLSKLLGD
jgi:1-aminocyclopropane-1-carboxylate deaminase